MTEALWKAPTAVGPLDARVRVPGSKSLSNRYLILAAMGRRPVRIGGLLRSRDTDLMIGALRELGVTCHEGEDPTRVMIIPPAGGVFRGGGTVTCGLAGTVMRFVPALAMLADGPTRFDGDLQAYARPMAPLLSGLEQLGARVEYLSREGRLPFIIHPPQRLGGGEVTIDSSASSQFISGLLLLASRLGAPVTIHHQGENLPSLPHIRMTVHDLTLAGVRVEVDEEAHSWMVDGTGASEDVDEPDGRPDGVGPQLPDTVQVEPDLSNAAPFLGAALIASGRVGIPDWPESTTQPGGLLPSYLTRMGGEVAFTRDDRGHTCLTVTGSGKVCPLGGFDLSQAGEIVPSIAAILVFADGPSRLRGIGHLRGHETNRLKALVTEINRVGGRAREMADGIEIEPVPPDRLHPAVMKTYADHRMATFAAMLGLAIPGVQVEDIGTTAKTLPDFPDMWADMVATGD
ncbi:3-phosphoshikimate 1-carboxyvinyltransferase [Bifidobacterium favimelis]|uniref:3-phosphoshikimate 1-carboxyvinyltransferase n=1 Tax=Bifidobacterium favimelis TaxID=3122979 RepID=A0ABU8ZNJ5_9BIFI